MPAKSAKLAAAKILQTGSSKNSPNWLQQNSAKMAAAKIRQTAAANYAETKGDIQFVFHICHSLAVIQRPYI